MCIGNIDPVLNESFHDNNINKTSFKDLGVYQHKNLNFKSHMQHVTQKLNKFRGLKYKEQTAGVSLQSFTDVQQYVLKINHGLPDS